MSHKDAKSLAIAYAVKRRMGKKMAHGGMMTKEGYQSECNEHCNHPGKPHPQLEHEMDGHHYAEGGRVKRERPYSSEGQKGWQHEKEHSKGVHTEVRGGESHTGSMIRSAHEGRTSVPKAHIEDHSKEIHKEKLHELREMPNPKLKGLAEGGFIGSHEGPEHQEDMIDRIMKKRHHMYAKGGEVANDEHEFDWEFDEPDEFDDMVLDDHVERKQHASNEHGDKFGADHDDLVEKAMMKWKKQRNPKPA